MGKLRFVCEWCHQKIAINDTRKVRAEVFSHFASCPRRSPTTTDAQIRGLSDHISDLISEPEQIHIRQAG